jgi:putative thioredoxin
LAPVAQAWRTLAHGIQSSVIASEHASAIRFATAMRAIQRGDDALAIDTLLHIVASDRRWQDDGARKTLLALFTVLGDTHPLVVAGRQQLAAVLF